MNARSTLTLTIYGNRGEHDIAFPARWIICPECDGWATDRGAGVECDGGGFTSSEWAEQDDDFREGYLAGRYDQPCRPCKGKGRIMAVDEDAIDNRWLQRLYAEYLRQEADRYACERIHAMERRMGA